MPEVLSLDLNGSGLLVNGTAPGCLLPDEVAHGRSDELVSIDLEFINGRITQIVPHGTLANDAAAHDLDRGMVLPTLVDAHTHLDKGHIWPRKPNPDGSFMGALTATGEDRSANWSAEDVRARMEFGLKCAFVHGTSAVRTHLDSIPPQDEISWPVFKELREDWHGRIELQAVCLFGIDRLDADDGYLERIAARVEEAGGVLGSVTYMIPRLDEHLDSIFEIAARKGLDLDFHVDETSDPEARSLAHIAEAALRNRFEGKIVCGHCCSLARQNAEEVDWTLDLVARAGVQVISLPMCNMYLQDRHSGRTPRWRGVTLLHEMTDRGIPVAVASDNTRDPFYAYGDLDLIEVYAQATRILHLDHPIADWIKTVSTSAAKMIGTDHGRLATGGAADLLLLRARDWSELLSRPKGLRDVIRNGKTVTASLPDYRELDHLIYRRETAQ